MYLVILEKRSMFEVLFLVSRLYLVGCSKSWRKLVEVKIRIILFIRFGEVYKV